MTEVVVDGPWAGWIRHEDEEPDTYLSLIGPSFSRPEGSNRATVAVETRAVHRNRMGALHGGFIAAISDHVGFAALKALGRPEQLGGVTIDLQVQFLGSGRVGPLLVAAATATFRKASEKK